MVVNSGSTGRIAEEIGQMAMNNGWKSYIAYGRNKRPSKSELIKIGTDHDMILHGLKTRILDLHGFGSRKATKELVEKIKQIKPDIIHLHNIHGYYLNIEILFNFLAKANIPVVWTLHDCWSFTGHCTHFEFAGCEKWKTQCNSCPQKKEYPASLLFDNSKQNYTRKKELFNSVKNLNIVAVSEWLAEKLQGSFLRNSPRLVIKNGIDLEVFKSQPDSKLKEKYKLQNKFIILGVASTWTVRKGFDDFIKLSKELNDDFRIVLLGVNKNQLKQLPSKIIGIERTENTMQMAELYSIADIYINPTYEDTFPTTNLEAIACDTPVITYKTGGSVESITSETGFVVEQGDIRTISDILRNLKSTKSKFKCRSVATNKYNKEKSFLKYLNLYGRILTQKETT